MEIVDGIHGLPGGSIDLYSLSALAVLGRGLPSVGETIVDTQGAGDAPGILSVEVDRVAARNVYEVGAQGRGLECGIPNGKYAHVIHHAQRRGIKTTPVGGVAGAQAVGG